MDEMTIDDLTAKLDRDAPDVLAVKLLGRSAARDAVAALSPLFEHVVATARDEHRRIALRFEALDYFNSSTIAALVHFLGAAQASGLPVEVFYDGSRRWQALSFDALRRALGPVQASARGPSVTFRDR